LQYDHFLPSIPIINQSTYVRADNFPNVDFINTRSRRKRLSTEEIKDLLKDAETRMSGALHSLSIDLAGIRTGRASPTLVERLSVEYYGVPTPLMQLASISVPEPRSLMIKPFDVNSLKDIEKAIRASNLGLNPNSDGKVIHLNLPPLDEERRRELVKQMSHRLEEARVAVRNIRRDLHNDIREYEKEKLITEDDLKRGEEDLQKLTDKFIEDIARNGYSKENEIMEV
jgi:ribosome recycling factor